MDGPGFYEITPSEVIFYPSVNESPIVVGPFDSQPENCIGFLRKNTSVPHSKESSCLFNEPSRKIMIDDYDYHRLNNPLKDLFGTLPNTATILKTIKLKEKGVQTTVAYLIDLDDATIQSDIVDTLSGKRYGVDKTVEQKDAINEVYAAVLSDLKQNGDNRPFVKCIKQT